ncbi:hypothetical protein F4808DRAFT_466751 [Astrocystis sublimbata]|nr:hypothetical protein F4808DRAFT_466751 [Astrocystis sublimbata]
MRILYPLITLLTLVKASPTPDLGDPPGHQYPDIWWYVIPKPEMGCWEWGKWSISHEDLPLAVNWTDLYFASDILKDWGENNKIGGGKMKGFDENEMAAWICNCKHWWADHVVPAELDEAIRNIQIFCPDHGGWVWSEKWQKSWNFGPKKYHHRRKMFSIKCPNFCLWSLGE